MKHHFKIPLAAFALLFILTGRAISQDGGVLHAAISNLRNNNGTVRCALYDDPAKFPNDGGALKTGTGKPDNGQTSCDFKDLKPGKYAVVFLHDENDNHKMDYNFLHMPKEGFGFSNNVHPGLSAPPFDSCAFDYRGGQQTIQIQAIYY